jgi:hypothetical protein
MSDNSNLTALSSGTGPSSDPPIEPVPVSPVPASVPSAVEVGKACVAMLDPKDFEPIIRRASEDLYERVLYSVQDYLRENTEYNIAAEIERARSREIALLTELRAIDDALGLHSWPTPDQRIESIQRLKASAIEARRAATLGAAHESATAEGRDAQTPSGDL